MKNWKQMAEAAGLGIPDIDRIIPALDVLESSFRPLVKNIPHDVEPAVQFHTGDDLPEEEA
ncbi:MAG TPA: hypothetical protein VL285_01755 [Bryobacteraceae bacterium]|jgi:hypothetical protein|nr:hypothetical protein [Bryobacteraceae bacterium]